MIHCEHIGQQASRLEGAVTFRDRVDAGEQLAKALAPYRGVEAVVYALPRGGVILGAVVAKALGAPLDLVIPRKIGHPMQPEYGICAVTESGYLVCNETERAQVDATWFEQAMQREREEARRRRERYLDDRPPLPVEGRVAIIVDDGIATGLTMRAAIHEVRSRGPREVVVAVPVIPRETADVLSREADAVVAVDIPAIFMGAVGAYYEDFHPISDEEVMQALREAVDPLFIFNLPMYDGLAARLLSELENAESGHCTVGRFPNRELYIKIATTVREQPCLVLGSFTPPDEQLLATLLLCHTLKQHGAALVTAAMPYLAYMRQDRVETGMSRATHWLAILIGPSGIDELVTVDIHSRRALEVFPVPVTSLTPAPLFTELIARDGLGDATLIAPDEGAIRRCEDVRQAAGIATPIIYMEKKRTPQGVSGVLHGVPGPKAVIIDDILDTGGTLVTCCELLQRAGALEITIMVTHGLFTGDRWQRLWELGVRRIYCTDSVPLPAELVDERIQQISIAPLLITYLSEKRA